MKRITLFATMALVCAMACQRVEWSESQVDAGSGSLVISVNSGQPLTKSNTDPAGQDAALHHVHVFLFKQDGSFYLRDSLGTDVKTRTLDGVKAGYYTVVALANAPMLTVASLSELEQAAIQLSDNDPTRGFLMYGVCGQTIAVVSGAAEPVTADIEVKRHVARVRLAGVTNNLPSDKGALTVKGVFLENVLSRWTCSGAGKPASYLNYAGRKAGRNLESSANSFIKTASDADCASLTFQTVNQTVARGTSGETFDLPLYAFPNDCTEANDHFSGATADSTRTRLVLLVSYGTPAEEWYYPVTLPDLARNTSYDVTFTISGPGSEDPNQRVVNGNLAVEIRIDPWASGGTIAGDF